MKQKAHKKMKVKQGGYEKGKLLLVFVVLFFIGIAFFFFRYYAYSHRVSDTIPVQQKTNGTYSNIDVAKGTFSEENTYLVRVRTKENAAFNQIINSQKYAPDYIMDLLQIPDDNKFSDGKIPLVYNFKNEPNYNKIKNFAERERKYYAEIFNRDYYIRLPKNSFRVGQRFENAVAIAKIDKPDSIVFPFLNSNKYCESDIDCTISMTYCTYGSVNWYKHALPGPFGCGALLDGDYFDETGIIYPPVDNTGSYDPNFDPAMGCQVEVKYGSAKCIKSRCMGQNRIVECIK